MLAAEPPPDSAVGWIEAALIIFFVVFLVIVARVLMNRSTDYTDAAQIPLEDDVVTPRDEPPTDGATP